eukprot:TRINITY_DN5032_c0_g1_i3.p1 TRINITY_DN5032_c0_g1~~TRINITY_DN5032_c0_g1_i3.p1  ORF type:complete len:1706 (+),score=357.78 TRINITY_DN5032_c0_g1_i3:28-5145(+)
MFCLKFGSGEYATVLNIKVSVLVVGFVARTELMIWFQNNTNSQGVAEMEFNLPENAVMTNYAVDLKGTMLESVLVEKKKAEVAFEKEARKVGNKDFASITQNLSGNVFKTKLFPFPKSSIRVISISYIEELSISYIMNQSGYQMNAEYELPSSLSQYVKNYNIYGFVHVLEKEKSIQSVPMIKNDFTIRTEYGSSEYYCPMVLYSESSETSERCYYSFHKNNKQDLDTEFQRGISIKIQNLSPVIAEFDERENKTYWVVNDFVRKLVYNYDDVNQISKKTPSFAIFWDASKSRGDKYLRDREISLIQDLIYSYDYICIDLYVFRTEVEEPKIFPISDGNSGEILQYLKDIHYDGATLNFVEIFTDDTTILKKGRIPFYQYDYCLLCSDGFTNIESTTKSILDYNYQLSIPIHTVTADYTFDKNLLKIWARKTGGVYCCLKSSTNNNDFVSRINHKYSYGASYGFISVSCDPSKISDVHPSSPTLLDKSYQEYENFKISGCIKLDDDETDTTIYLNYGFVGSNGSVVKVTNTVPIKIGKNNLLQSRSKLKVDDFMNTISKSRTRLHSIFETPLVPKYCGLIHVEEVLLYPELENQEAIIVQLSQKYKILTPLTTFILLETLEQFIEHNIEPDPVSQPLIYHEWHLIQSMKVFDEKNEKEKKLNYVNDLWNRWKSWWSEDKTNIENSQQSFMKDKNCIMHDFPFGESYDYDFFFLSQSWLEYVKTKEFDEYIHELIVFRMNEGEDVLIYADKQRELKEMWERNLENQRKEEQRALEEKIQLKKMKHEAWLKDYFEYLEYLKNEDLENQRRKIERMEQEKKQKEHELECYLKEMEELRILHEQLRPATEKVREMLDGYCKSVVQYMKTFHRSKSYMTYFNKRRVLFNAEDLHMWFKFHPEDPYPEEYQKKLTAVERYIQPIMEKHLWKVEKLIVVPSLLLEARPLTIEQEELYHRLCDLDNLLMYKQAEDRFKEPMMKLLADLPDYLYQKQDEINYKRDIQQHARYDRQAFDDITPARAAYAKQYMNYNKCKEVDEVFPVLQRMMKSAQIQSKHVGDGYGFKQKRCSIDIHESQEELVAEEDYEDENTLIGDKPIKWSIDPLWKRWHERQATSWSSHDKQHNTTGMYVLQNWEISRNISKNRMKDYQLNEVSNYSTIMSIFGKNPINHATGHRFYGGEIIIEEVTNEIIQQLFPENDDSSIKSESFKDELYNKFLSIRDNNEGLYSSDPSGFIYDVSKHLLNHFNHGPGLVVLSNMVEMSFDNHELIRMTGFCLSELSGCYSGLTVNLFRRLFNMRPEEPQSILWLSVTLSQLSFKLLDSIFGLNSNVKIEEVDTSENTEETSSDSDDGVDHHHHHDDGDGVMDDENPSLDNLISCGKYILYPDDEYLRQRIYPSYELIDDNLYYLYAKNYGIPVDESVINYGNNQGLDNDQEQSNDKVDTITSHNNISKNHRLCDVHENCIIISKSKSTIRTQLESVELLHNLIGHLFSVDGDEIHTSQVIEESSKYLRESLELFSELISKSWDPRFSQIEVIAITELNHIFGNLNYYSTILQSSGSSLQQIINDTLIISSSSASLTKLSRYLFPIQLDIRVSMSWNVDDLDVELIVEEPDGEIYDAFNNKSENGYLTRNFTRGYGPQDYLIRNAHHGTYKFYVKLQPPFNPNKIPLIMMRIWTNFGIPEKEQHRVITRRISEEKKTILFASVHWKF